MGNHETEIPRGGGSFARQGRILSGKERDRLGKDVVKCVLRSSEMQMRPPCMDWFLHFFALLLMGIGV